jgi:hypothetical protein
VAIEKALDKENVVVSGCIGKYDFATADRSAVAEAKTLQHSKQVHCSNFAKPCLKTGRPYKITNRLSIQRMVWVLADQPEYETIRTLDDPKVWRSLCFQTPC